MALTLPTGRVDGNPKLLDQVRDVILHSRHETGLNRFAPGPLFDIHFADAFLHANGFDLVAEFIGKGDCTWNRFEQDES